MKRLSEWWKKRWVKAITFLFLIGLVLFLFRFPILRGIGNYLVASDPLEKTECYFILGGNSYERGAAAFKIYQKYPDAQFVATGGNYPMQIRALDTTLTEASLTRHWMISQGVPGAQVDTLSQSTSTIEEVDEILGWCKGHSANRITLISSSFHLRRMRMVFEKEFREHGIEVRFQGALDQEFNQTEWWKDELSLITVNNEYVKIVYYWLKY